MDFKDIGFIQNIVNRKDSKEFMDKRDPCSHCDVGWGSISTTGTTSCRDCCLRPRNYRRYCTTKLVWAHANVPSELPEPTELRNKYSDSNYLVMAKVGFPNPQNQYEIYVLTSNDIWTKLDDFHDITTYKFEDEVIT